MYALKRLEGRRIEHPFFLVSVQVTFRPAEVAKTVRFLSRLLIRVQQMPKKKELTANERLDLLHDFLMSEKKGKLSKNVKEGLAIKYEVAPITIARFATKV